MQHFADPWLIYRHCMISLFNPILDSVVSPYYSMYSNNKTTCFSTLYILIQACADSNVPLHGDLKYAPHRSFKMFVLCDFEQAS